MEEVAANPVVQENIIQWAARFMNEGGVFMWIIAIVWCMGIAIAVERLKAYFKFDVDGASMMGNIKKNVIGNQVQDAIQSCSESPALLSFVMKNGLKRANQSKEQIQDALEASILEAVPKIEKRLSYLALAANLSTLLGLLGTIQGLIQSFAAVAQAEASQKAQLLAEGIAVAMNTTALGLVSAISLMVVHSVLMARGEKMIQEIEENSVKLLDLLATKKGSSSMDKAA
ncbi:MotA/TolQ/ExbB proton channel family protein [Peredibacter starrii]|uniref:MotA/TolQ/ExbB proton channel family protein n=1 Tax=Peredibacter starrii TaxID=28202 RepID=A0AAX4HUL2_9BACT|nr:MotA/TolQ/ExbB proton channel family protein [Peredibacter starrii]WPU67069.1 MotA/TolQ/ExbB proton channel family protein [Peredibacter starrii]